MVATTNDGIEVIMVMKKIINLSCHLFLLSAAIDPSIIPKIIAKNAAIKPIFAEIGKLYAKISLISRPFLRDTPKSPCAIFFI